METTHETYLSPFTWRYGSQEMRALWSEKRKRLIWRRLWLALAEVQSEFGLVSSEQVDDLRRRVEDVDIERALQIESQIHHDLMAEVKAYAEQCPLGGGVIHLGATSMDIKDNADALRVREALGLILTRSVALMEALCRSVETYADLPVIAFTHLQPAEPTTLGYRLAGLLQDIFGDWQQLAPLRDGLRGKGFKGAVGTNASYADLLGVERLDEFEKRLSARLELPFFPITTQIYPRKQDYQVASALAGLGASLYKFAFDLRILQSPPIGELAEPFGPLQVGSSAMPFKRNPINAEKIDSLGRALAQMPRLAWDNAAHSLLEITLDDSANRRTLLPEMFLICDELLTTARHILAGLQVNQEAIARNLGAYTPFAATERVLLAATKRGADRQEMHERLRQHSLSAWKAVQSGDPNPLGALISNDPQIVKYLAAGELDALLDASRHIGDAPQRARRLVETVRQAIGV